MARIRSLKIGFFQNEELAALSPHHRLMFAGLWLLADRAGRLEDRPKRIAVEIFPYEVVDGPAVLEDLARAGLIQRYGEPPRQFIQILGFSKHQRPHPKEPPSVIPEPWKKTASRGKTRRAVKKHDAPGGILDLGSGLGDLGLGDLGQGDRGDGDKSVDQDPRRAARALCVANDFAVFWAAYPKKTGKAAALKAWQRARPPIAQVLEALAWQTRSDAWNRDGGRYRPNPATYLNQGRWQDEPENPAQHVRPSSRTGDTVTAAEAYLQESLRGKA